LRQWEKIQEVLRKIMPRLVFVVRVKDKNNDNDRLRARATSMNTMANIKVPGFQFAGVACGIRKSKKKDLALIFSDRPAAAAGLFTTNRFKAAPVQVGIKRIKKGWIQAIVANSGNANACTGDRGLRDAETMCRDVGQQLGIEPALVIPSSTGVIGVPLPMEKVRDGIRRAAHSLSPDSFSEAAEAILTMDRFVKVMATTCRVGGKKITLAGMAKGAGMIAPKMATMLAYFLTDGAVDPRCLRALLKRSAESTFNCITVDGDVSTNDTAIFLANGFARNAPVRQGSREEAVLERALLEIMKELALKLVEDGEGATKLVEIQVRGARSDAEAKKVAFAVANSQLVKAAFFGADPNFGRILAAIGYSGVSVNPERTSVSFDGVTVARSGVGINSSEREASRVLRRRSFAVRIDLGQGTKAASVWTSDLSYEYIRINSAYRT
jgi:glutamate N-acetyltransferase/amino-acid N-acetyltransferase